MKNWCLIGLLSFLLPFLVVAQPLLDEVVSVNYIFSRTTASEDPAAIQLLTEHSARIAKPVDSLRLRMNYELIVRVNPAGNNASTVSIFFQFKGFAEDAQFQGLPFSFRLMPIKYKAVLAVLDGNGNISREYPIEAEALQPKGFIADIRLMGVYIPEVNSLTIKNQQFNMPEDVIDRYYEFVNLVSEYKLLDDDLALSEDIVNGIDINDPNSLALNRDALDQMSLFLDEASRSSIIPELGLRSIDPLQVLDRTIELRNRLNVLQRSVQRQLSGLDIKLYNQGVAFAMNNQPDSARLRYLYALQINPYFVPAKAELALSHMLDNDYPKAEAILFEILNKDNPDPASKERVIFLAKDIYSYYVRVEATEKAAGNYAKALQALEEARRVCGSFPLVTCDANLLERMQSLRILQYRSQVQQMEQLIAQGRMETAYAYYKDLQGFYWQLYAIDVSTDSLSTPNSKRAVLARGLSESSEKSFREGNLFLARTAVMSSSLLGESSDVAASVLSEVFARSLERADSTTILPIKDEYLHYFAACGLPFQQVLFSSSTCEDFRKYASQVADAYNAQRERKFELAAQHMSKAGKFISAASCPLVVNEAMFKANLWQQRAEYYAQMKQADSSRNAGDLASFFFSYARAETRFVNHELYLLGVEHEPMTQHLLRYAKDTLYEAAVFFAAQGAIHKSVGLLLAIGDHKPLRKSVRKLQENLGIMAANLEYAAFPEDNPANLISRYTFGHPNLKFMQRALQRRWDELAMNR